MIMKRLLFFFALATVLSSCGDTIVEEYYTTENTNIKVVNLTAPASSWTPHLDENGLNLYYSCSFEMPEITPAFYETGTIQTYYMMDGAQQALPYVRHFETELDRWTRTVDFEYSYGSLTVFVTNSDFAVDAPGRMDFRAVLMW